MIADYFPTPRTVMPITLHSFLIPRCLLMATAALTLLARPAWLLIEGLKLRVLEVSGAQPTSRLPGPRP